MDLRLTVPLVLLAATAQADEVECDSARYAAARRAVERWCNGQTPTVRPYYDWSPARTRHHACADLRAAFRTCDAWVHDSHVTVDFRGAVVTYWDVLLVPHGPGFKVVSVDYDEDCTGP